MTSRFQIWIDAGILSVGLFEGTRKSKIDGIPPACVSAAVTIMFAFVYAASVNTTRYCIDIGDITANGNVGSCSCYRRSKFTVVDSPCVTVAGFSLLDACKIKDKKESSVSAKIRTHHLLPDELIVIKKASQKKEGVLRCFPVLPMQEEGDSIRRVLV